MRGPIDPLRLKAQPVAMDRREFLRVTALAGGGLLVGCGQSPEPAAKADASPPPPADADLNAFVRILADDSVTVFVKHLDKGQGIATGLTTIVAEELDAAWSQMGFEFAPANAALYNNLNWGPVQGTGGSSSIANSWMQLRKAAAAARAMLVSAAAERWDVPAAEITVNAGRVAHTASGQEAGFGALAGSAAGQTPPADPPVKDPSEFKLIGSPLPRLDSDAKTDGSAVFTIDVDRPGQLHAAILHPPKFGATLAEVDDSAARAVPGVTDVIPISRGVAVLADSFWTAVKGRDALVAQWDFSKAEARGSDALREAYEGLLDDDGLVAASEGAASAAFDDASGTVLEQDFHFPFLAHATMEPMNCVVELGTDRCDIWTGSQFQTMDQGMAARIAELPPEQVFIHTQFAGGSFGRRAVPDSDFVAEAVQIARAIEGRAPVKLQWTRENDLRGGRYRPMSVHRLRALLDADGHLVAWQHRLAIQSFLRATPFEGLIVEGVDQLAVEGAANLPYAVPNLHVDLHLPDNGVPTLWWRSVGHTHNAYVTEVFLDQVAHAGGKDPFELRRSLLAGHPRHLGVLELAAEKAGWGEPLEDGRSRGIAVHESFGTFVAEVVEVSVAEDGHFSVDRVVCAVDCGIAVNPDVVKAQMEGGIGFALSAALREAVHLVDGEVQEGNFDTYRPLRIGEMPAVEVHIVPSAEAPTGVGEPGVPPLAPALANALFAATGRLISELPIGDQMRSA